MHGGKRIDGQRPVCFPGDSTLDHFERRIQPDGNSMSARQFKIILHRERTAAERHHLRPAGHHIADPLFQRLGFQSAKMRLSLAPENFRYRCPRGFLDILIQIVEAPAQLIGQVRALAGSLYGRRMYEVMRYWDEEHADWDAEERDYADAWRRQPKWVVSRSLESVGPNATLVQDDLEAMVRRLKDEVAGDIEVAGPELAQSLTDLGLVDEYRLYIHPVVLGRGKPFFAAARPPLRLVARVR